MSSTREKGKLDGKLKSIFVLILMMGLMILSLTNIYDDLDFIITKRDSVASVVKIVKTNDRNPYVITLRFFDKNHNDTISANMSNINVKLGSEIQSQMGRGVNVFYTRLTDRVYLQDSDLPNFGTLFIHSMLLLLMVFGIYLKIRFW